MDALVEFLKQFLYTLGGTAIAVAALAWLARSVVKHWLSKDVEAYKHQLKAESDMALESLRSDLQILAARRNIEYSRVHEKRLEIISEIAGKIRDFHEKVTIYTAAWEPARGPSKEERRTLALNAFVEFNKYFLPRSFFLPKKTVQKIQAFRSGLQQIFIDFFVYVEQGRELKNDPDKEIDVWRKANEYTDDKAPMLIDDLEDEFRKILGIEQG